MNFEKNRPTVIKIPESHGAETWTGHYQAGQEVISSNPDQCIISLILIYLIDHETSLQSQLNEQDSSVACRSVLLRETGLVPLADV